MDKALTTLHSLLKHTRLFAQCINEQKIFLKINLCEKKNTHGIFFNKFRRKIKEAQAAVERRVGFSLLAR